MVVVCRVVFAVCKGGNSESESVVKSIVMGMLAVRRFQALGRELVLLPVEFLFGLVW